ncbi:MAG TPA: sigma-E factor negative regulatory protein [Fontimonas sp.]
MAKDSISALLDGECTPAEIDRILEEMARSPALGAEWSRQCMARDAVEGVRMRKEQPCICAGVMAGLDAQDKPLPSRVTVLKPRRLTTYWKPLAGLAAAASVAAIAVTMNFGGPQDPASTLAEAQMAPPVVLQAVMPASNPGATRRPANLRAVSANEEELRSYLLEHSNSVAERGMGATLSYARFAAHSIGDQVEIQPAVNEGQP